LKASGKPRLLSLNTYNYRRGGSDAAFLENDRLFSSHGWDTAVFTMHHPKNEPSPWSEYFAGRDRVRLRVQLLEEARDGRQDHLLIRCQEKARQAVGPVSP
jgi:hypothetical protein